MAWPTATSAGRRARVCGGTGRRLKTVHFVLHHPASGALQTPTFNYPLVQDVLAGATHEARRRGLGFNLISADYYSSEPAAALRGMSSGDGLIVMGASVLADVALAMDIPVVAAYLCHTDAPRLNWVVYDRMGAVGMGVRHLI